MVHYCVEVSFILTVLCVIALRSFFVDWHLTELFKFKKNTTHFKTLRIFSQFFQKQAPKINKSHQIGQQAPFCSIAVHSAHRRGPYELVDEANENFEEVPPNSEYAVPAATDRSQLKTYNGLFIVFESV